MIISEYTVNFTHILFGYLRDTAKTKLVHFLLFRAYRWTPSSIASRSRMRYEYSKLDPLCFHLSFLNDCISGYMYPNEIGVKVSVFRNHYSLLLRSSILNNFWIYHFWYTLYIIIPLKEVNITVSNCAMYTSQFLG